MGEEKEEINGFRPNPCSRKQCSAHVLTLCLNRLIWSIVVAKSNNVQQNLKVKEKSMFLWPCVTDQSSPVWKDTSEINICSRWLILPWKWISKYVTWSSMQHLEPSIRTTKKKEKKIHSYLKLKLHFNILYKFSLNSQ